MEAPPPPMAGQASGGAGTILPRGRQPPPHAHHTAHTEASPLHYTATLEAFTLHYTAHTEASTLHYTAYTGQALRGASHGSLRLALVAGSARGLLAGRHHRHQPLHHLLLQGRPSPAGVADGGHDDFVTHAPVRHSALYHMMPSRATAHTTTTQGATTAALPRMPGYLALAPPAPQVLPSPRPPGPPLAPQAHHIPSAKHLAHTQGFCLVLIFLITRPPHVQQLRQLPPLLSPTTVLVLEGCNNLV